MKVNNKMIKLILCSTILCLFTEDLLAQECTADSLRKFDSTFAKLITIGNSGRKFPESKGAEVKQYCDQSEGYIKDLEVYKTKCLTNLAKQVTGVLIYAVKNTIKQLCKKDSKRLDLIIAATPCANKGNGQINKCYTKMIDGLMGIQNEKDDKKKIPQVCCEYFKIFPCMRDKLNGVNKCTNQHVDTIVDFINSIAGNVIDLLCGDYTDGSDKCLSLSAPPKKRKDQRRNKSIALPMIEVLKSFPEV